MSGILDLLNSDMGKELVSSISQKTGIDASQASNVVSSGLPALMGAMQSNLSSGEGASGLLSALTSGKHDGGILDNIGGFLNGGDFSDGSKILGHVLGGNQDTMVQGLSSKTGVDSGIISKILPMLAPIVMGYLGKQTKSNGVSNGADLSGMLGSLLGGAGGDSILTSVLDQNGDGKLDVSDAMSALSGKKNGGLGGLLGGLFGKK
jgi:hypothetical protein